MLLSEDGPPCTLSCHQEAVPCLLGACQSWLASPTASGFLSKGERRRIQAQCQLHHIFSSEAARCPCGCPSPRCLIAQATFFCHSPQFPWPGISLVESRGEMGRLCNAPHAPSRSFACSACIVENLRSMLSAGRPLNRTQPFCNSTSLDMFGGL